MKFSCKLNSMSTKNVHYDMVLNFELSSAPMVLKLQVEHGHLKSIRMIDPRLSLSLKYRTKNRIPHLSEKMGNDQEFL